MSLLWPVALAGLFTLPIILILHLLRSRRERFAIPSLLLWRGLEQERRGGAPRKIPLSLMLLLQLLVACALTFGLARPALSFLLRLPRQTTFVLDVTTSMTATDVSQAAASGQPLRRFDVALRQIQDHIDSMNQVDAVTVVSLGPTPQILVSGTGEQKSSLLSTLDSLTPGAVGTNLTAALSLASNSVDSEKKNQIVVLTDGNFELEDQPLPSVSAPVEWQFIPEFPGANLSNQALFDVSSRTLPDGRHRIFARVVNYGDAPVIRTLRLLMNDQAVREASVEIDAQSDVVRLWTVPASAESVAVEIIEPDALPLDNRADLLLLDITRRPVLLVSEEPETLTKALEVQPGIDLTVTTPELVATQNLADFDLIVFDGFPPGLAGWPQGNILVVDPSLNHPLLSADTSVLNLRPDMTTASSLLSGVDLSGVYFGRVTRLATPEWATVDLMAAVNEVEIPSPLIFHGSVGNSRIAVWSFDLEASNLPARLALPLLTANTLSMLLAPSTPASIDVGEPVQLSRNFTVETPDGQRLMLSSGQQNNTESNFTRTKKPGLYKIYDQNDTLVAGFAVHAGSGEESNLQENEARTKIQNRVSLDPIAAPSPEILYQELWPWLAGAALAVVAIEGWLAWRR